VSCAAVPGKGTDDLARQVAVVLADNPDWGVIIIGINDIATDVAVATIVANIEAAVDSLVDAGANVLLQTVTPMLSSNGSYTTTRMRSIMELNDALKALADTRPCLYVADAYAWVVDPTSTTSQPKTNYTSDGLHPSPMGAYQIGVKIAEMLDGVVAPRVVLATSAANDYSLSTANRQLCTNPLLTGTGGTASGGGVSGSIAASWTVLQNGGATIVCSKVARADGFGDDQQLVVTAAANNDGVYFYNTASIHAGLVAGDTIVIAAEVSISSCTALKSCDIRATATVNGIASTPVAVLLDGGYSYQTVDQSDRTLVLRSVPIKIEDAATVLRFQFKALFGAAGGAVFKLGRCSLLRV
jgi:lysophospholipase L1-like esterase